MLKLNVGLSKKVGEPNYGSRGASVNLELEVEAGLANEPNELHDRMRRLFRLAKSAIDEELGGSDSQNQGASRGSNGHGRNGGGHDNGSRPATRSQCRAIHAIADRNHVDLVGLLRSRFHVETVEELSLTDASSLIDELKGNVTTAGANR